MHPGIHCYRCGHVVSWQDNLTVLAGFRQQVAAEIAELPSVGVTRSLNVGVHCCGSVRTGLAPVEVVTFP